MLYYIYARLYTAPFYVYIIVSIMIIIVWTCFSFLPINRKIWRYINLFLFVVYLGCVLYMTLFSRSYEKRELSLIPFSVFMLAQTYPDVYNQIAMNVLMFVPFGILLPYVLNHRIKYKIAVTIALGLLISSLIEVSQYIFMRGLAETDDLIFNTLGVCIGTLSYLLYSSLLRRHIKKRHDTK